MPWPGSIFRIDLTMRNKEARRYRERVIPQADGLVLEIGGESGLNLPFYGPAVPT